jgi:hypothetical protein
MRYLSILLILLGIETNAFNLIPNKDVMYQAGKLVRNPKYVEAAVTAQKATFIHYGVDDTYVAAKSFLDRRIAIILLDPTKDNIDYFLLEIIDVNPKYAYMVVSTAYISAVRKTLSVDFKNPLYQDVRHNVTLTSQSINLGIRCSF